LFQRPFRALGSAAAVSVGFVLAIWAIVTIRKAGTRVEINKPTTTIVADGPYRVTRNPIYIGMFLGQTGLAIGFDNLWVLATLVPFYLVIRYRVIAREEAYLERTFGAAYLGYKSRVRRCPRASSRARRHSSALTVPSRVNGDKAAPLIRRDLPRI
jgi:protein-S-isoprenylcysteine O-methyltransferase Ste14